MSNKYSRKETKRDFRSVMDRLVDSTRPASLQLHHVVDLLHSGARMYKVSRDAPLIGKDGNFLMVPPRVHSALLRLKIIDISSIKYDDYGRRVADYKVLIKKSHKNQAVEVSREDERRRLSSATKHISDIKESIVDVFV